MIARGNRTAMLNKVQLITYIDRIHKNGNVQDLISILESELAGLFGTVHLLPFYYPIDGADAGFDPINHTEVDTRLGDWVDIHALSDQADIMADIIVNHVSADSSQFLDVLQHGADSPFDNLFLTLEDVFPAGVTEPELLRIYRPRPGLPFTVYQKNDGTRMLCWTTFTDKQIDINVESEAGKIYLNGILRQFHTANIKAIRLDAAGYAIKRAGTSCFMLPETFDFISEFSQKAGELGMEVLVEIHSYYKTQIAIAQKVDWVYDFALPPLILHAIYRKTITNLTKWMEIRPQNAITVLDTHDGIGVIDVGRGPNGEAGILEPEEIEFLVETIHEKSRGESRKATGAAASNLDLYQVNCTYFDALGKSENAMLLARAIQFFSPGIPQVYYVGLFAGENDMDLLAKTGVGRDINRHYFTKEERRHVQESRFFEQFRQLILLRNTHQAFLGTFSVRHMDDQFMVMAWNQETHLAELALNFAENAFHIRYTSEGIVVEDQYDISG